MSLILPLGGVLVFMSLVMAAGWVWQKRTNNSGWVDVFWTYGTGLAAVALALLGPGTTPPTPRQLLVAGLVALWSLRLGTFIAVRVAKGGHEDSRYANLKKEWGKAYQARLFWFMQVQAPATMARVVSILLAAANPAPGLGVSDLIGAMILLGSIAGEGLADQQMATFRADPANRGKVCDTGLWGWSRHPNYFFEFLGWVAYPVMAFQPSNLMWAAALAAPAAMYGVLRFGTGVPPLEAAMLSSRGDKFRAYQARVPVFIPFPPPRPRPAKTV